MSELNIPVDALNAAVLAATDYTYTSGEAASLAEAVLRQAGPALVAAHLLRMAERSDIELVADVRGWLRDEARELDPNGDPQ